MNNTQLIIEMYKNGIGINKISAVLKISYLDVCRCLNEASEDYKKNKFAERDKQVCEMYKSGLMITEVAQELKINRHTVTSILKNNNVYKGNIRASNDSDSKKERNALIISLYKKGLSMRKVADEVNVSAGTVSKVLKHYNEASRPAHAKGHSKGTTKNRKHFFDLDFFEVINTEEKAYWLGFLYADGYVSYRGSISLSLQEKDVDHLKLFRKALKADDISLVYKKDVNAYSLNLCSVKMSEDLIKLGCIQKKSLVLKFPTYDQVPKDLINHFMRGYFDGDGCIYVPSITRNSVFSVLGTHEFLDEYEKHFLEGIGRITPNKRVHQDNWNENTECINYGGREQIFKIFNFLYKDATIYLKRKFDKFNKILPS